MAAPSARGREHFVNVSDRRRPVKYRVIRSHLLIKAGTLGWPLAGTLVGRLFGIFLRWWISWGLADKQADTHPPF
jgi:hypothetical protein